MARRSYLNALADRAMPVEAGLRPPRRHSPSGPDVTFAQPPAQRAEPRLGLAHPLLEAAAGLRTRPGRGRTEPPVRTPTETSGPLPTQTPKVTPTETPAAFAPPSAEIDRAAAAD